MERGAMKWGMGGWERNAVSVLLVVGLGTGGARYLSSGCSESSKGLGD
jgi:hypothetical protein